MYFNYDDRISRQGWVYPFSWNPSAKSIGLFSCSSSSTRRNPSVGFAVPALDSQLILPSDCYLMKQIWESILQFLCDLIQCCVMVENQKIMSTNLCLSFDPSLQSCAPLATVLGLKDFSEGLYYFLLTMPLRFLHFRDSLAIFPVQPLPLTGPVEHQKIRMTL